MGVTRQYQEYYMIYLDHWQEDWAGSSYNSLLVKNFPSQYVESTATLSSSYTDMTYIYPSMYANKYYLDGIAEGHFSLFNISTSNTADLDSYTVTLKKSPDVPNSEETLGTVTKTLTSENTVGTEKFITPPFYMNIDKQLVEANEKLLFKIEFTASGSGSLCIACANDSSDPDTKLRLPYAPQG